MRIAWNVFNFTLSALSVALAPFAIFLTEMDWWDGKPIGFFGAWMALVGTLVFIKKSFRIMTEAWRNLER